MFMLKTTQVSAAAAKDAELLIYDDIGETFWGDGVTAKQFDKDLKSLGKVGTLTVRINSLGGVVWDGIAIYNTLARASNVNKRVVVVDGIAASAASVIAMAGDEILMGDGTFIMIHNAASIVYGEASELRKQADVLDSISKQVAEIYSSRTANALSDILEWMGAETWFSQDDAIAVGFADGRSTDVVSATTAKLSLDKFKQVPLALQKASAHATPRLDAIKSRMHRATR